MRQQYGAMFVVAAAMAVLWPVPVRAVDTCTATIKTKDGTILVSAKHVTGTLTWGWTATTQIQPFFDPTCVKPSGKASNCTQGAAGTPLAQTAPPDCTLQLKDSSTSCTAYVKKCTPGKRPVVEFPVRFAHNGDGTVTDTKYGLMWEQKTNDSTIHDMDNTYSWSTGSPYNPDGTAYFTFLATLNGPMPFAGYGDWRLPTITELETIVDLTAPGCGGGSPCIDQTAFGPTQPDYYWSATTLAGNPFDAHVVYFFYGIETYGSKTFSTYVRAVRSGS